MIATWHCPSPPDGVPGEEMLVAFDRGRPVRVLICPAWFGEANKLRRFTLDVMRRLDRTGIDSFLPDLPGCNESLARLENQTLAGWTSAMAQAARDLRATHVLAIRAGALVAPPGLPGWHYAAQSGPGLLRTMIRAETIAAREAGRDDSADSLMALGRERGLVMAGWPIGADLFRALETAEPVQAPGQTEIDQTALGGPGLWLRAEPGDDANQADRLAQIIAQSVAGTSA